MNWPRADNKEQASLQPSGRKHELHSGVTDNGSRRGHMAAGKASRLLGCSRRVALECSVPRSRCRGGATTAEANGGSRESRDADPRRHHRGRRSGSVGTALLENAHNLQRSSSEHRVPGRWDVSAQFTLVATANSLPTRVDTLKNGQISEAKLLRSLEQSPRLRQSRLRCTLEP